MKDCFNDVSVSPPLKRLAFHEFGAESSLKRSFLRLGLSLLHCEIVANVSMTSKKAHLEFPSKMA